MAIDILQNCHFSGDKLRTLHIGSRLTSGDPITYPIQYLTVSGTSDSMVLLEAWDTVNNILTIGGQQIQLNKISNMGDNLTFDENLVIDQNGKRFQKNIVFTIPKITLFTTNQIKEFVMTNDGKFALSPTIALLIDENDQTLIIGYDKPLYLMNKELLLGEENLYRLTYQSNSYSRARAYSI